VSDSAVYRSAELRACHSEVAVASIVVRTVAGVLGASEVVGKAGSQMKLMACAVTERSLVQVQDQSVVESQGAHGLAEGHQASTISTWSCLCCLTV
jgi:hypothetical protein